MTEGRLDEHVAALAAQCPQGTVSYVDREWLAGGGRPMPALSFRSDGEVAWRGQSLGELEAAADPTTVAAGNIVRVARDAAAAASEHGRGAVEVVGSGLIAATVRRLTGNGSGHPREWPGVIVDTTGDPEAIRSALDRAPDLGMVVLAGESGERALDLDLYSSVHRRGLVVVGVASPLHAFDPSGGWESDDEALDSCFTSLAEVSAGASVSGESLWYRVVH